ncbi:hypothetical protein [Paracoccus sp. SM22M-07]|uniref:hypothetical protein n=1 Tax=Paracoccus sp. SM22M-07 TaxID=1520813 RepID=UPI00147B8627|nr:hypothetical protein [Paracoccus sp. SM22M-07]
MVLADQTRRNALQQSTITINLAVADEAHAGNRDLKSHCKNPELITFLCIPINSEKAPCPNGQALEIANFSENATDSRAIDSF